MTTRAIILINGVSLPYHVLDMGISIAKNSDTSFTAVFLYENADSEVIKDTPADEPLSKADFSRTNAEKSLVDLITHNAHFASIYFAKHNVDLDTIILHNPTMDDVVATVEDSVNIYFDPETFKYPEESAYVNFSFQNLNDRLGDKLVAVTPLSQ